MLSAHMMMLCSSHMTGLQMNEIKHTLSGILVILQQTYHLPFSLLQANLSLNVRMGIISVTVCAGQPPVWKWGTISPSMERVVSK